MSFRVDAVEIMNRFTEYSPSKGETPLPLPIPGFWFKKICALADRIEKAENRNDDLETEIARLTAALRDANEDAEARVVELEDRLSEIVAYGGYYADIEKHVPPDGQVVKVIASSPFGVDDFTVLRMDGKWYFDYDQPREVPSGFEIIRIKPWDVKLFSATDDEEF